MRNLKKVLALVLAMAMALSLAVTAGAAFNDQDKIVNDEAVDVCSTLGIINGRTDGSFDPAGNVTRAEMAKMICIVLNGGKEPTTATKATPTYADIDGHWAEGYIEYCSAKGVVAGVGGGNFNPNGSVTGSQAAKMLLVALGYNADVEKMVGANWELYTNVLANQDGLYNELESMDPSAALSRDNAAQMIYNTLNAYTIKVTSTIDRVDGSIVDSYSKTDVDLLAAKFDAFTHTGVVTAAGKLALTGATAVDEYITVEDGDSKTTDTFKIGDADYTELVGQTVDVLYKVVNGKAEVYGVYATSDNTVFAGSTANMKSFESASMKLDGKTVKFDSAKAYVKNFSGTSDNYVEVTVSELASLFSEKYNFAVSAIDNDDDGKVEVVLVDAYVVGQVKSATSSAFTVSAFDLDAAGTKFAADVKYQNNASIKYDYDDADVTNPTVYDGMAREDYVIVTKDALTGAPVVEVAAVVEGEIAAVQGSDLKIGDAWYANVAATAVKAGDEAKFYMADDVIFYIGDVDSSADVNDYVLVTGTDTSFGVAQIKVLKADGTTAVLEPYTTAPANDETYKWLTSGISEDNVYRVEAKGDQYKFYAVSVAETMDDFDDVETVTTDSFVYNKDNNAKTTLAGDRIADDAVIFACVDGTYKVIAGSELQGMNITKASAAWNIPSGAGAVAVSKTADSGLSYVQLGYIGDLGKAVSGADSTKYAYVVDNQGTMTNADGDIVSTITIANGTANPIVLEGDSLRDGVAQKGYLIKYDVNSDGTVDMSTVASLRAQDALAADKLVRVAITGVEGNDIVVDQTTILTMDADTAVLYVNLDDVEGADEFSIPTADKDVAGAYIDNAYVIYEVDDGDNIIKLLVLESDNDLKG